MPLTLHPGTIALRLALAVIAGLIIGFNRSEYGHVAGLRTTLLVCVAAAIAMVQANILLATTTGTNGNSALRLDMMRLPLGVLSGIGFIGAGAIFRRGDLVQGVTTAATMWLVTVLGLCFGGGQIGLGLGGLAIGWTALWGLKRCEAMMPQYRTGQLELVLDEEGPSEAELDALFRRSEMMPQAWSVTRSTVDAERTFNCALRYPVQSSDGPLPPVIDELSHWPHILSLHWRG